MNALDFTLKIGPSIIRFTFADDRLLDTLKNRYGGYETTGKADCIFTCKFTDEVFTGPESVSLSAEMMSGLRKGRIL